MRAFTIKEGPTYLAHEGPGLLSGFYRAEFVDENGEPLRRYLTDKGRAELLRRVDDGQREFSQTEIEEMSVTPSLEALEERTDKEAGEGA
jgi:hypothetical protein